MRKLEMSFSPALRLSSRRTGSPLDTSSLTGATTWWATTIHSHVYSCQYGNFIGNNQRERVQLGLRERTHSLWSYLWKNQTDYINPLYRQDHSQTQGLLRPSTAPYCFK
ncbi:Myotubularin-related protein 7 [Liparis tanakae]|uniref:Myotubularin-related protein 7 n=1 Tax=Liparis tanakae TaxID=230148 RepID=A0A4Z2G2G6_9TELE|nr:Myotubularin-related protein 7 [Liparis tanakae]